MEIGDENLLENALCLPKKNTLRRLAEETGISKSAAAKATKLLKLRLYKVTAVCALQPRVLINRIVKSKLSSAI